MSTLTTSDRATHANGFGSPGQNGNGNAPRPPVKKRKKRTLLPVAVLAGMIGLGGAAGAAYYFGDGTSGANAVFLTTPVQKGPLVISVTESGTIKAAQQAVIKSEVEGRVSILSLVPEGEAVKRGDLLVELDTTDMVEEKLEREIRVQNAEAAFVQAQEALAVAENQAEADVKAAELEYQFAQEDIKKYLEGDYVQELNEAQARITIADEERQRAAEKLEGSQELFDNSFISESELKADELSLKKAELDLEVARGAFNLLEQWDKTRKVDEFEANVEQTRLALERAKRKASADVVQAQADLRAKKAEYDQQKGRLERDIAQIEKGKIYAPTDGMVVYASSAQGGWRGNDEPLEAGQEVRERQDLIYLPTPQDRIAEVKVHESALDKMRVGLPARVTIDALPGREYWGTVQKVSPLPDATTVWLNPDLKVYSTEILIPGINQELRTGMSCRAEIIVDSLDNALSVPVQSVVRINGEPHVFVVGDDGQPEQKPVKIGLDNNSVVVIEEGIGAGEKVLLAPPLQDTGTNAMLKSEDLPDAMKQQAEQAKSNPTAEEGQQSGDGEARGGRPGGDARGGRPGGGGGDRGAMMRAYREIQAKATDEEKEKMRDYMTDQDWSGLQTYTMELAKKYGVSMGGSRTAERGGEAGSTTESDAESAGPAAGPESEAGGQDGVPEPSAPQAAAEAAAEAAEAATDEMPAAPAAEGGK